MAVHLLNQQVPYSI